jgi:hypothetical protein
MALKIGYPSWTRRQRLRLPRSPLQRNETGLASSALGAVTKPPSTAVVRVRRYL